MKCNSCGRDNVDGSKFCVACGSELTSNTFAQAKFCPKCGNEVEDGAVFCSKCGNNLNNTQQQSNTVYSNAGFVNTLEEEPNKPLKGGLVGVLFAIFLGLIGLILAIILGDKKCKNAAITTFVVVFVLYFLLIFFVLASGEQI